MPAQNIFAQFTQPVRSVADYEADYEARDMRKLQLQAQQRQNALAALTQQQTMRTMADSDADRNALQSVAAGWNAQTTPEQRIAALRNSGRASLMTQADALEKQSIERTKGEAEAKAKQAEVLGKVLTAQGELATRVFANPTPQAAAAAIANMKAITQALGVQIDFSGDEAALGQFQSPDQIKQWAAGHALKAEQLLPKLQALNAGGQYVNQAVNPVTGQVAETGRTDITQSADNRANQETSRANNQATVGAQYANAAAAREQANATRDAARITARAGDETAIRKEFADLPEVKKYKNAIPAYQAIVKAAQTNNPQADINLIYGLAKLYDPDSVVREGEYDTIANSQSIPEWLKGQAQRLAGGGKLTPATKSQIIEQANIRIGAYKSEVDGARSSYESITTRRGLDPKNVFPAVGEQVTAGGGLSAAERAELEQLRKQHGRK